MGGRERGPVVEPRAAAPRADGGGNPSRSAAVWRATRDWSMASCRRPASRASAVLPAVAPAARPLGRGRGGSFDRASASKQSTPVICARCGRVRECEGGVEDGARRDEAGWSWSATRDDSAGGFSSIVERPRALVATFEAEVGAAVAANAPSRAVVDEEARSRRRSAASPSRITHFAAGAGTAGRMAWKQSRKSCPAGGPSSSSRRARAALELACATKSVLRMASAARPSRWGTAPSLELAGADETACAAARKTHADHAVADSLARACRPRKMRNDVLRPSSPARAESRRTSQSLVQTCIDGARAR